MVSFLQSHTWKNLMSKLYGFGAALVIIGALFKLQHWNGAGYMLSIGMLTEFVIFIFSAFEPVPKEYEWGNVFPELLNEPETEGGPRPARPIGVARGGSAGLDIDPATANDLKSSIGKFSKAVGSLDALSTIADASTTFVGGVHQAAGNMAALNNSMKSLNDAYQLASQTMTTGGQQIHTNFEVLNKHLAAVNASYELYIQEHKQYVTHSEQLVGAMKHSADQSYQFTSQMQSLNSRVGELNAIYGSMLSAVNMALKKR